MKTVTHRLTLSWWYSRKTQRRFLWLWLIAMALTVAIVAICRPASGVEVYYDYTLLTRGDYTGAVDVSHAQAAQMTVPSKWLRDEAEGEDDPVPGVTAEEWKILSAFNAYREQRRLPRLLVHPTLLRMARERVDVFHHNHPRHGWAWEHARRLGWRGPATDNLAQGYQHGVDAVDGWASSNGHAMQMRGYMKINGRWVNQHFDYVGAARRGNTYVLVLGRSTPDDTKREEGVWNYERPENFHRSRGWGGGARRPGWFRH